MGLYKKESQKTRNLRKVIAFAPTHEEQERKTLHSHWQIWVEELSEDILESHCGMRMQQ
jgi:hypothetical protein